MRILLLEDETVLNQNITKFLTLKGYSVESYDDGKRLLEEANLFEYDFFIFDIDVPNIDGFELLTYIRGKKLQTPLIFITALIGIEDVSRGFKLGCSDYLKKPFDLHELELRMQNINNAFGLHDQIKLPNGLIYEFGSRTIRTTSGKIIILSKKQANILYILMKHKGHVVSFETIAEYIYEDNFRDIHTISSHIRDIRKIIGAEIIKNVRGIGYKVVL